MIISVASGKGGTGKTTVSANLALSIEDNVQLLDCDVEEPNAHIFIKPQINEKEIVTISVPEVDLKKCKFCGKCGEVCAFNAIAVISKEVLVFPELCHSCGACSYLCPQKAIQETQKEVGIVEIGEKYNLQFIHGKLNVGEVMAIPVIKAVKTHINGSKTVIIDAPPGTSCPVIESVKNSDFCVLVTEPTPFGLNDLILAVETLLKMEVPFGVVINRSDLGNKEAEDYCKKENIPILMRIPFSEEIAVAYSKGISVVEHFPEYRGRFRKLYNSVKTGNV